MTGRLKSDEEVIINWWSEEHPHILPGNMKRIDYNARRRIDTRISHGESSGVEYDHEDGVKYTGHWRIIKKR